MISIFGICVILIFHGSHWPLYSVLVNAVLSLCGFQQFIVLYNGERGTHDTDEFRCYRVLAILNGKACIIDTKTQMHYGEFIESLEELGVKDALYCDMGSGWNYSWYRTKEGKTEDIIGLPWLFSHNWLVFKK